MFSFVVSAVSERFFLIFKAKFPRCVYIGYFFGVCCCFGWFLQRTNSGVAKKLFSL